MKMDKIINVVMDSQLMCFEILSLGFYADNGGEFVNVKMDKLTSWE